MSFQFIGEGGTGQLTLMEMYFAYRQGESLKLPYSVIIIDRDTTILEHLKRIVERDGDPFADVLSRTLVYRTGSTADDPSFQTGTSLWSLLNDGKIIRDDSLGRLGRVALTDVPELTTCDPVGHFGLPRQADVYVTCSGLSKHSGPGDAPEIVTDISQLVDEKPSPVVVAASLFGGTGAGLTVRTGQQFRRILAEKDPIVFNVHRDLIFVGFLPYFNPDRSQQRQAPTFDRCKRNAHYGILALEKLVRDIREKSVELGGADKRIYLKKTNVLFIGDSHKAESVNPLNLDTVDSFDSAVTSTFEELRIAVFSIDALLSESVSPMTERKLEDQTRIVFPWMVKSDLSNGGLHHLSPHICTYAGAKMCQTLIREEFRLAEKRHTWKLDLARLSNGRFLGDRLAEVPNKYLNKFVTAFTDELQSRSKIVSSTDWPKTYDSCYAHTLKENDNFPDIVSIVDERHTESAYKQDLADLEPEILRHMAKDPLGAEIRGRKMAALVFKILVDACKDKIAAQGAKFDVEFVPALSIHGAAKRSVPPEQLHSSVQIDELDNAATIKLPYLDNSSTLSWPTFLSTAHLSLELSAARVPEQLLNSLQTLWVGAYLQLVEFKPVSSAAIEILKRSEYNFEEDFDDLFILEYDGVPVGFTSTRLGCVAASQIIDSQAGKGDCGGGEIETAFKSLQKDIAPKWTEALKALANWAESIDCIHEDTPLARILIEPWIQSGGELGGVQKWANGPEISLLSGRRLCKVRLPVAQEDLKPFTMFGNEHDFPLRDCRSDFIQGRYFFKDNVLKQFLSGFEEYQQPAMLETRGFMPVYIQGEPKSVTRISTEEPPNALLVWSDICDFYDGDTRRIEVNGLSSGNGGHRVKLVLNIDRDVPVIDLKQSFFVPDFVCMLHNADGKELLPSIPFKPQYVPFVLSSQVSGTGWEIKMLGQVTVSLKLSKMRLYDLSEHECAAIEVWPPRMPEGCQLFKLWSGNSKDSNIRLEYKKGKTETPFDENPESYGWFQRAVWFEKQTRKNRAVDRKRLFPVGVVNREKDKDSCLTFRHAGDAVPRYLSIRAENDVHQEIAGVFDLGYDSLLSSGTNGTPQHLSLDFGTSSTVVAYGDNNEVMGLNKNVTRLVAHGGQKRLPYKPEMPWAPGAPSASVLAPEGKEIEIPSGLYITGRLDDSVVDPFVGSMIICGHLGPGAPELPTRWLNNLKWHTKDNTQKKNRIVFLSSVLFHAALNQLLESGKRNFLLHATYPARFGPEDVSRYKEEIGDACQKVEKLLGVKLKAVSFIDEGTAASSTIVFADARNQGGSLARMSLSVDIGGETVDITFAAYDRKGTRREVTLTSQAFGADTLKSRLANMTEPPSGDNMKSWEKFLSLYISHNSFNFDDSRYDEADIDRIVWSGDGDGRNYREDLFKLGLDAYYFWTLEYLARFVVGTLADHKGFYERIKNGPGDGDDFDWEDFERAQKEGFIIKVLFSGNGFKGLEYSSQSLPAYFDCLKQFVDSYKNDFPKLKNKTMQIELENENVDAHSIDKFAVVKGARYHFGGSRDESWHPMAAPNGLNDYDGDKARVPTNFHVIVGPGSAVSCNDSAFTASEYQVYIQFASQVTPHISPPFRMYQHMKKLGRGKLIDILQRTEISRGVFGPAISGVRARPAMDVFLEEAVRPYLMDPKNEGRLEEPWSGRPKKNGNRS